MIVAPGGISAYELALRATESCWGDSEWERQMWIGTWWSLYRMVMQFRATFPLIVEYHYQNHEKD